ncbi:hypothetical protein A7979_08970 [Rothia nasimurium]|uniref:GP-PDE domain-containing protein n=1 Tax=Rothia nasimurium TaxID=85336 RepID=A0A1Y1RSE4_9MICC|nr:glycerophosphodiester phosphodiesterase family protein [Rothia nasimurium]ORC24957.1 hypothetical protein A7979_08970 [Rothia nasimurium]
MPSHAFASPPVPAPAEIFAHRGLALHSAENTLGAFSSALDAGADWIETDVNTTADGVAVVFHDPTLSRLASHDGRVAEMTWEQVRRVELTEGGFIPSLEQALSAFPQTRFNIDLKDAGAARAVVSTLVATESADRVRLASFSERRLRQAQAAARRAGVRLTLSASQSTFILFYAFSRIHPRLWNVLKPFTRFFLLPFDAVQVPACRELGGWRLRIVDRKLVAAARAAGVQVHVWTIDDEPTMRQLLALGVDGIVTNRSDLLASVLASSG